MSAVAEAPPAETQQDDSNKVRFVSTDNNLRLVIRPKTQRLDPAGQIHEVPGLAVQFSNGIFEVDPADADSEEILEFMYKHQGNGSNPDARSQRLFVEAGKEPDRPPVAPDASPIMRAIVQKTAQGDADGIADLFVQERSSHSRPEVLAAAEEALKALEADVPAPPQTPEHEVERARVTGPDHPGVQPATLPARTDQDSGTATAPQAPVPPDQAYQGHVGVPTGGAGPAIPSPATPTRHPGSEGIPDPGAQEGEGSAFAPQPGVDVQPGAQPGEGNRSD